MISRKKPKSKFQPTRPLRGATYLIDDPLKWAEISTHAPYLHIPRRQDFNPRAPCGARLPLCRIRQTCSQISTHAPLAGRDPCVFWITTKQHISTHAPLAGRDRPSSFGTSGRSHFNPRAPCGARRLSAICALMKSKFQPTRPLRGATSLFVNGQVRLCYFNPRAPCGARQRACGIANGAIGFQPTRPLRGATLVTAYKASEQKDISTHAPLAGRDSDTKSPKTGKKLFQPTRPLRGATYLSRDAACGRYFNPRAPCGARLSVLWSPYSKTISTHAPLAGRDWRPASSGSACRSNFNPRAPCGARRFVRLPCSACYAFQPTRPLRGATRPFRDDRTEEEKISTHAPLAGRDGFCRGFFLD